MDIVLRENTLQSAIRHEARVVHMGCIPLGANTNVPVVLDSVRSETVEDLLLVPALFVEPLTHGLKHDLLDSSFMVSLIPVVEAQSTHSSPLRNLGGVGIPRPAR
jgi:hypothetical protein